MLYYEMAFITCTDYVSNNVVMRNIETEKNNCTYVKKKSVDIYGAYNDWIFQGTDVATECDKRLWLKIRITNMQ